MDAGAVAVTIAIAADRFSLWLQLSWQRLLGIEKETFLRVYLWCGEYRTVFDEVFC